MAHRDFDADFDYGSAEGHTFTLGAKEFRTHAIMPPGAFFQAQPGLAGAISFLRRAVIDEDRAMLESLLELPFTSAKLLDAAPALLDAARAVASAEKAETRKGLTATLKDIVSEIDSAEQAEHIPVSAAQIMEVYDWLVKETVGRPLVPSSPSSDGGASNGNGSKGTSRKRASSGAT